MSEGTTRYLGLDVHKATITVAVAEESGPPSVHGTIANEPAAVRKLVRQLCRGVRLMAAYEAGPTGYALHRELTRLGVECLVAAPSLIPIRPGDRRIKTDSRDALVLARLLRNGDLTAVWVPDPEHEALRDLVRARYDAKDDQRRARHRLAKFLLRQGVSSPPGTRAWSARYYVWLNQLSFSQVPAQVVLDDYRVVEQSASQRVRGLELALRRCAEQSPQLPLIAALQVLRGIAFLSAVTIAAEVGDFRRFANAPGFMCFTGLVTSEHSSGASRRQGGITRTGNRYLRHVLVQAAHNARYTPNLRGSVQQHLDGLPPDLVELALRAQRRLYARYRHLDRRIGRPKAVTAVARELAGFVWAVGRRMSEAPAA